VPVSLSPITDRIAGWLGPSELAVTYPGIWLRPDVYATHGHYLDRHITVPSFERLAVRAIERLLHHAQRDAHSVDDYEAVLGPIYALLFTAAQNAPPEGARTSRGSIKAWEVLVGDGRPRPLRHRLIGSIGLPAAVMLLNRIGLGPLRPRLSGVELRRAGLQAMADAVGRLGIDAEHVIFGHTHRAGPFPGDDLAEWRTGRGARLLNTGSWVYEQLFVTPTPGQSPYWPGCAVELDDEGPPRLVRLLMDRTLVDFTPVDAADAPVAA
jgi:hypothetical protein